MKKVYVIRHGLTEFNKKRIVNSRVEEGLSPEGIEQAKEAAPFLPKSIKHIYASPLLRAKQTAEILNSKIGAEISFRDELKEVNFGLLDGTAYTDEIRKKHRSLQYDWHSQMGESVEDVKIRVLHILKDINASNGEGEALIVTHGGIIRLMYLLEQGSPVDEVDNVSLHSFDLDKIAR